MMKSDKRIQKGEKTHAKLLHQTIEMIAENGIKAVSTAKLASAIGVSKSTIFHHFQSSEEVLTSALHLVFEELLQFIHQREYRNVEDFLQAIGQSFYQMNKDQLTLFKAFLAFLHEGVFDEGFRQILHNYAEQITALLHEQLTQLAPASVKPQTIETVSKLLLPMMDGIGFHYLLNRDQEKCQQMWKLQTKMILQLFEIRKPINERNV
jgi:AcrR family transcriptional regulator